MAARKGRAKTDPPDDLPAEAKKRIGEWVQEHCPHMYRQDLLRQELDTCLDWHRMKGNMYADWEAAFRNWLRKKMQFQARDDRQLESDNQRGRNIIPISDYLGR